MSDFDFDALRDPVAPEPGPPQRAGVDARARALRSHARRGRLLASAAAVVAVAAIATGVVAATRSTGPSITVANPSTTLTPTTTPTTYGPSVDSRFIPPTSSANGRTVLPVTLSDGERFNLSYPPEMQIAQLGFVGSAGVNGKLVTISYTTVQHTYGGSPAATFPGADGGTVSLFHANQRSGFVGSSGDELVFQFDKWLAFVEAPPNAAEQARWARDLSGTTDANGYLVLHATGVLTVGNSFEGGFGVVPGNSLQLASNLYCGQPESDTSTRRRQKNGDGSEFVSWCVDSLHVTAEGSAAFLDQAEHELQISLLRGTLPSNTDTTTTTAPVEAQTTAVSASFVSPDQGFVLEQNGRIDATSDGGTTWSVAGSLPAGSWKEGKIRFIDSADGFAFYPHARLYITHDGGATWTTVVTPFRTPVDLAILNGKIYAVGFTTRNTASFGIWSTPVEHLVWKRDPLSLPIGAGPIPTVQIVLAGAGGWIVENDRTVVAGARLQPNGSWTKWDPPCADKNASAYLAAASESDLVGTCMEGAYGGSTVTNASYFSHDGGATFSRQEAPNSGPVAMADSGTAIVPGAAGLVRTTDDGGVWRSVSDVGLGATDLGFTSSQQGFVIFTDGKMLMTRDAGASWTPVTLP